MATLTDVQKTQILDHLQTFGKRPCPVCGHVAPWDIHDMKVGVVEHDVAPPNSIPLAMLVMVTCHNCGYVLFFNAKRLNIPL